MREEITPAILLIFKLSEYPLTEVDAMRALAEIARVLAQTTAPTPFLVQTISYMTVYQIGRATALATIRKIDRLGLELRMQYRLN